MKASGRLREERERFATQVEHKSLEDVHHEACGQRDHRDADRGHTAPVAAPSHEEECRQRIEPRQPTVHADLERGDGARRDGGTSAPCGEAAVEFVRVGVRAAKERCGERYVRYADRQAAARVARAGQGQQGACGKPEGKEGDDGVHEANVNHVDSGAVGGMPCEACE